jgi:hypothetical protein
MIYRPDVYLKHNISETELCLWLVVEPSSPEDVLETVLNKRQDDGYCPEMSSQIYR